MFGRQRARSKLNKAIESWMSYRQIVFNSMAADRVTPEQESAFLKLKAGIAAQLQELADTVPRGIADECHREFAKMLELLKRHRGLGAADRPAEWSKEKFEGVWHEHYIFLSKLKGASLVPKQPITPQRRKVKASPTGFGKPGSMPHRRSFFPGPLRFVFWLVVIAAIIYGVGWGFGIHQDTGGRFVTAQTSQVALACANVANAAVSMWDDVEGFFKPVVNRYGKLWTIIIVAVLLLSIGYLIFIRG